MYDGGDCVQERDDAGLLTKQFVRGTSLGGGIGGVLYNEDASAVREYFVYNAIGSTVATVSGFWPLVVESTNDYDAFGNVVATTGATDNNRLFCTKERSSGIGLDNFGMRYYDPVLGRFLTRDPAGYPDGPNNYLYCRNNPINHIDPLGLQTAASARRELLEEDDQARETVEYFTKAKDVGVAVAKGAAEMHPANDVSEVASGETVSGDKSPGWSRMAAIAGLILLPLDKVKDAIKTIRNVKKIVDKSDLAKKTKVAAEKATEAVGTAADAIRKGAGEAGGGSGFKRNSAGQLINEKGQFVSEAGGESAATIRGRAAHDAFDAKVQAKGEQGWQSKPRIVDAEGNVHIPDALTPSDRPIEYKPRTPSGIKQGRRQLNRYEHVTGKKGRLLTYEVEE